MQENLRKKLIDSRYDHWTPLVILFATKGNNSTIDDYIKYFIAMEDFLKKIQSEVEGS